MFNKMSFHLPESIRWKILIGVLAIIYLLFPNSNHLADSYAYGASVKYGVDLFYPHHLLYIWINYLLYQVVGMMSSVDALRFMQAFNAIVSLVNLILLRHILKLSGNQAAKADWLAFAVGVCFGVMRFSVEAEVYIMPVLFSLLSSLYFLKYLKKNNTYYAALSGSMATLACLFHQIHLFWGIGLFIGWLFTRRYKAILSYLAPTPLVLAIYAVVLHFYDHTAVTIPNLFHYLASYYYSDNADVALGLKDFLITAITFFRTFFQVHGLVAEVFTLMPIVAVITTIIALALLISGIIISFKKKWFVPSSFNGRYFELTHIIIFTLQFTFAFFSHGNSEFMIMLPFALVIAMAGNMSNDTATIKLIAFSMLSWNLIFGIVSNHIYNYQNQQRVMELLHNNPEKILVVKERNIPVNIYFYMYGAEENKHIIEPTDTRQINIYQKAGYVFWTDILSKKTLYDRASFTDTGHTAQLQFIKHVQEINSDMGVYYIDEVNVNKNK